MNLIGQAEAKTSGANGLESAAPAVNASTIASTNATADQRLSTASQIDDRARDIQATGAPQTQAQSYTRAVNQARGFGSGQMGVANGASGIENRARESGRTTTPETIRRLKEGLSAATEPRKSYGETGGEVIADAVKSKLRDDKDTGKGYPGSAVVNAPPIKGKGQ
jgi:hypothetical protein